MGSEDKLPTVYIVDDDQHARGLLEQLVRSSDYATEVFVSAESFLNAVDQQSTGCLFVDLRMPGMDGLELHQKLQNDGYRLPTIMITADVDVPSAIAAI